MGCGAASWEGRLRIFSIRLKGTALLRRPFLWYAALAVVVLVLLSGILVLVVVLVLILILVVLIPVLLHSGDLLSRFLLRQ